MGGGHEARDAPDAHLCRIPVIARDVALGQGTPAAPAQRVVLAPAADAERSSRAAARGEAAPTPELAAGGAVAERFWRGGREKR